jgi:hypothetical protein
MAFRVVSLFGLNGKHSHKNGRVAQLQRGHWSRPKTCQTLSLAPGTKGI